MTVVVQRLTDENQFEEVGRVEDGEITAGEDALTAIDDESVWTGMSPDELTARFDGPRVMAAIRPTDGEREQTTQEAIGVKQTPEGVPDGYVYVSPDEEVGDEYDVVESDAGGTYRSPEPVDDGDGGGESTLASPNEINTTGAASDFFSASPIQTENVESLLTDDQLVAAASAFSLIEQSATTNLGEIQAHFSDKPSGDRPGSFSTVDDENLRGDVFFEAESLDEVAQLVNSALASFNPASGAITAFPDNIDDLPEDVKDGIVSDGDAVENIFLHEMGHAIQQMKLEEENSPTTARGLLNTMKSGSLPEDKLKEEISTRATSNGLEAAAEMFVYQLRGNELPEELQELYEQKGGVEVDV